MSEVGIAMADAFRYEMRTKFASAMKKGLVGVNRQIEQFAKGLEANFGNPGDAEQEFSRIAALMRTALIASYEERVEGEKHVPSYREGAGRYAGGALRRALSDPSMAIGDANGISYINRALLDTEARHWKRLNFGAGGAASQGFPGVGLLPVFLDERVLFYVGSEGKPRPAFTLPPGFWKDPGSGTWLGNQPVGGQGLSSSIHQFFPGGFAARSLGASHHPTRGITARHFIDAGFEVLSNEFGIAIGTLFEKWSRAAAEEFHPSPVDVIAE